MKIFKKSILMSFFLLVSILAFTYSPSVTYADSAIVDEIGEEGSELEEGTVGTLSEAGRTLKRNKKNWDKYSQTITEDYVKVSEDLAKWADECLAGIVDFSGGFSLTSISFSDLMNKACEKIQSKAEERLNKLENKYTSEAEEKFFAEMPDGADDYIDFGEGEKGVNVDDKSDKAVDKLWEKINSE